MRIAHVSVAVSFWEVHNERDGGCSPLLAVLTAGADGNKLLGSRWTQRNLKWRPSPSSTFRRRLFENCASSDQLRHASWLF